MNTSRRPLPNSPFSAPSVETPVETYEVDDRVTNDKFGLGSVVGVEPGIAVLVDFGGQRVRVTTPSSTMHKL